jgi:hypothetical protein
LRSAIDVACAQLDQVPHPEQELVVGEGDERLVEALVGGGQGLGVARLRLPPPWRRTRVERGEVDGGVGGEHLAHGVALEQAAHRVDLVHVAGVQGRARGSPCTGSTRRAPPWRASGSLRAPVRG